MNIVSWNVNGLRAILKKDFSHFLSQVNPDILCLQETKLHEAVLPPLNFFKCLHFHHASDKKGYSGTAVWAHFSPSAIKCVDVEPQFKEGRVIVAEYNSFYLVNVYVPNSQPELARLPYRYKIWDVAFRNFLIDLQQKKPLIVCGDFNVAHEPIDLARPESNHFSAGYTDEERANFSKLLLEVGLTDVFRWQHPNQSNHYTWWSYRSNARERNVGWRIDYFLLSKPLLPLVKHCTILKDFEGSDHAPLLLDIALSSADISGSST